jgi:hypothetical protein
MTQAYERRNTEVHMLQQMLFERGTARHCEWTPSQNQTPRAQPDRESMRTEQSQPITYCVVIAVVCVGQQGRQGRQESVKMLLFVCLHTK